MLRTKKYLLSYFRFIFASLLFLMIVTSCNEPVSLEELDVSTDKSLKDEALSQLSVNLASSFENSNVKAFIKNKSLELIDGDYNFLVAMNHSETIESSNTGSRSKNLLFSEVLAGKNSSASNARVLDDSFIEDLLKEFPLLQVAVPELESLSVENWDVENEDPLVAYVPETIVDDKIEAYDKEGNVHYLSASEEPDRLVIIISENERIMALPRATGARLSCGSELTPIYEDEAHSYVLRADYFEAQNECTLIEIGYPISGGSGGSGSNEENCDRDNNNDKDNFNKLMFKDMKALKKAEAWLAGNFEMRLIIVLGNKNSESFTTLNKVFVDNRKAYRGCAWFNCWLRWNVVNEELLTWDKEIFGSHMKYLLYEENPDSDKREAEVNLTTTFSDGTSVTGKTTIELNIGSILGNGDYWLGEAIVEYCDNTDGDGYKYETGEMYFYVNQK